MDSAETRYNHLIGKVIDDRYEVLKVKGIGGMAVAVGKVYITNIACALILGIVVNAILSKAKDE